jgi:hypothetical protein
MRAYDTALGYEVTCNGTSWVASGGTGTIGDITITDNTPEINFIDANEAGTSTLEGSINVNCPSSDDCDMIFAVNSGADTETTVLMIDTDTDGASVVGVSEDIPTLWFLDANSAGTSSPEGAITVNCATTDDCTMNFWAEAGATLAAALSLVTGDTTETTVRINGNTPTLEWQDIDEPAIPDADPEGAIGVSCVGDGDCEMTFAVNSGADTSYIMAQIDTDTDGASQFQIGNPAGANYVTINEAGKINYVGTARPDIVHRVPAANLSIQAPCATNANTQIGGGPIVLRTVNCTDADGGAIGFELIMTDNWDGGDLFVRFDTTNVNAAPDEVMNGNILAQCRGTDEVINNTWGTAAISVDYTTSCQGGDICFIEFNSLATSTGTDLTGVRIIMAEVGYPIEDNDEID